MEEASALEQHRYGERRAPWQREGRACRANQICPGSTLDWSASVRVGERMLVQEQKLEPCSKPLQSHLYWCDYQLPAFPLADLARPGRVHCRQTNRTEQMAIRLRLARHHLTRNAAQYNLVATESSRRPTAQPLELLGTYNPRPAVLAPAQRSPNGQRRPESEWGPGQYPPRTATAQVGIKAVEWNLERVRHWLSQGALPSKAVEKLLVQAGVISQSYPPPSRVPPVTDPSLSGGEQTPTRCRSHHRKGWSCPGNDDCARQSAQQKRREARSPSRNGERTHHHRLPAARNLRHSLPSFLTSCNLIAHLVVPT